MFGFGKKPADEKPTRKEPSLAPRRTAPRSAGIKMRFAAGEVDNLTASFMGSDLSINEELRRSLKRMRQRSRKLWMDNDYAKNFYRMLKANVVGPNGIALQAQFINDAGRPDHADRNRVEAAWSVWGKRRNCSVDGQLSWINLQALVLETCARDGEVLIEQVSNRATPNGPKLRILEPDHLDTFHNERLGNGRRIVMGVELDRTDRPIAYHLSDLHPGERGDLSNGFIRRRRVPADRMIHVFRTERPGQVRGFPWIHSAIRGLAMMGGIAEAELVASRLEASKCIFYTSEDGATVTNMDEIGPTDPDAESGEPDLVEEIEPGMAYELPTGVTIQSHDPQHPNTAFDAFNRLILRGVASGAGVSYPSLANDPTGVNFSSLRSFKLDEQEQWRVLQTWFAEQLHDEVYRDWLVWNMDVGQLTMLPMRRVETKYQNIKWQARGWQWVDPLKDITAIEKEYHLGTATLSDIARAKGKDLRDVLMERKAELDMAAEIGVAVGQVPGAASQAEQLMLTGDDNEQT